MVIQVCFLNFFFCLRMRSSLVILVKNRGSPGQCFADEGEGKVVTCSLKGPAQCGAPCV